MFTEKTVKHADIKMPLQLTVVECILTSTETLYRIPTDTLILPLCLIYTTGACWEK